MDPTIVARHWPVTPNIAHYEGAPGDWDTFVRSQPGWSHFHLHGWRSIMMGVLGHDSPYLAARSPDGRIVGVLPLVRVKSILFGHFLVSMPFLNYGGPLGDEYAVRALVDYAVAMSTKQGVSVLELRGRSAMPVQLPVSHRKITVLLDIPEGGSDALWKQFDTKVRNKIRRPQKEGVTMRFGHDQIKPFFDILARRMRDLGTPTQSRSFFDAIGASFPDDVTFGCAYHEDRAIAGGCAIRWGDEMEMTWSSALRDYDRLAPNMLMYWEFMRRAADTGARVFNFGRSTPNGGTHEFKRQWGTHDEPLWWYEQRVSGASTPAEGNGAVALGPRLWKKLPLSVANTLGPRIVRFIP